eukprot:69635-Prorocentrum_minimum.AAC.1
MFGDLSKDPELLASGVAGHWPFGRGCYISADKEVAVWVSKNPNKKWRSRTYRRPRDETSGG